jgi:hypothetical protein
VNRTYNHLYHLRFYGENRATVFSSIYKKNHWANAESVSGPGSTLQNTSLIRDSLPQIISRYQIKTMLDIPCGDFNWMQTIDLKQVKYTGMDIVSELIQNNTIKFANDKRQFRVADLVTDELPKVDLIFCRDCFVHLSFKDIQAALVFDIITGNWRQVNLQSTPFNLPPPLEIFYEGEPGENKDKSMGLWHIGDLM